MSDPPVRTLAADLRDVEAYHRLLAALERLVNSLQVSAFRHPDDDAAYRRGNKDAYGAALVEISTLLRQYREGR